MEGSEVRAFNELHVNDILIVAERRLQKIRSAILPLKQKLTLKQGVNFDVKLRII